MHGKKEKINYKKALNLVLLMARPYIRNFCVAGIYLLFTMAFTLIDPIIIRHILDYSIPSRNYSLLAAEILLFAASNALFLLFNYFMYAKLIETGQSITYDLKKKMYRHILSLDMGFFASNPAGRLSARIESDSAKLYDLFTETSLMIFKDIIMFFAAFGIMAYHNLELTLLLLPLFPLITGITWIFARKSSPLFVKARRITSEIGGYLAEQINFMETLQAFFREKHSAAKLNRLNRRKFLFEFRGEFLMVLFFTTVLLLSPLSTGAVFGFGGYQVLAGKMTVGILVMFIMYLDELFEPVFRFSEHISVIQKSFSAIERINQILNTRSPITEPASPVFLSEIREGIEFRNVWFRYSPDSQWVLKDLSISVPKNRMLAIVGETGGGKTTIASLLLKFYLPQKGRILFDGKDISSLSIDSVRKLTGLVQQDIYMFPGTVMENIKIMDPSVPDEKVRDAVRKMRLEDFFAKHPPEKRIREKGANISIGEKQVVSLLRAMVLDQPVLILDEATAHVDPYSERMLTESVRRLSREKTLVVIAHRLSTIKQADKIVMISGGRKTEEGTHSELMAKKGLYYKFYRVQFG